MGKLNIAHHKSYHPYRRDNIEKVRRDEEEAKEKEEREEGRMRLADSEARIDRLREKAGVSDSGDKKKKKKRKGDDGDLAMVMTPNNALPTTAGHINLFEDLEHVAIAASLVKKPVDLSAETDKGFPLAPPTKDLKPWYTARTDEREERYQADLGEEKRRRDIARQSLHDPLTAITRELASSSSSRTITAPKYRHLPITSFAGASPEVQTRLTREASERERAAELLRRKGASRTSQTPARDDAGGYTDLFNRREVEDARREREHKHHRDWNRIRNDRGHRR